MVKLKEQDQLQMEKAKDLMKETPLEHMGFVELSDETKEQLEEYANPLGDLNWSDEEAAGQRIGETMALIGATTEYQFG